MTSRLLAGVRAVELTEVWAGPMGGSLLGDLGADVVKVESFPRMSVTRTQGRALGGDEGDGPPYERSATHHIANRNKRNIALDLRTDSAAEILERLIAGADLLFEGYSAGTLEGMGFGWERVHALNPRLAMISMPGWGVEGPYRGYVTLGSGLDAASGHASVRGYPDRGPEDVPAIYHSDATGALTLVFAAVTALRRAEATGEGCFVDLSQTEALLAHLPALVAEWTLHGQLPERLGNRDPHVAPHGCYPAAGEDAWVVVAAETDAQWAGLVRVLGRPQWAEEGHPLAGVVGRLRAREEIDAAIAAFTREREQVDAADAIQAAGAIAAPVVSPAAMLASPQLTAREWFQTVEHRYAGVRVLAGFPWSMRDGGPSWDRACGLVGEHNHEVLRELGYSDAEIESLQRDAAIGDCYETPAAGGVAARRHGQQRRL